MGDEIEFFIVLRCSTSLDFINLVDGGSGAHHLMFACLVRFQLAIFTVGDVKCYAIVDYKNNERYHANETHHDITVLFLVFAEVNEVDEANQNHYG